MKNVERVAVLLAEEHIGPCAQIARRMAEAGLLAPDPQPRYRLDEDSDIVGCSGELVVYFHSATDAEREAVLAALNALPPEEGEKP